MTDGIQADRNFVTAYYVGIGTQLFKFVLIGTLTLLVSRRRSKIAMWVSIALFALCLVSTLAAEIITGRAAISHS